MDEEKTLEIIYKEIAKSPASITATMEDSIRAIRKWLIKDSLIRLDENCSVRIDDIILKRIRRGIPHQQLIHMLNTSFSQGGAGIRIGIALHMSERLETLMGSNQELLDLDANKN